MIQLSSNSTLFFKIFVPVFWLTFFGALWGATVFSVDEPVFMGFRIASFRIGITIFWLVGLAIFYLTSYQLKRVDADHEYIYVSNYFKNFRYPYSNVEKIKTVDLGILDFGSITLVTKGNFGKKIRFIRSNKGFKKYLEMYPEVEQLLEKEA